jgi:DNA repair protein RecO (recombination protein O)
MHAYKFEGIIIGRRNFSETDRLITVLTKNRGKQVFRACGVRKITSQRGPRVEIFNYISGQAHQGRTWDILGEIETLNRFENIRKNLPKVGAAYEICELVDRLIMENDADSQLVEMVYQHFINLNEADDINLDNFLLSFKVKLLGLIGFLPQGQVLNNQEVNNFIEDLIHAKIKSKVLR